MIRCPHCKRFVVLHIKDEKIICPECGEEIAKEDNLTKVKEY